MKSINSKIIALVLHSVIFNVLLIAVVGLIFSNNLIESDSQKIINLTCDTKVQEMNSWFQSVEQSVNTFYEYCNELLPYDKELLSDLDYMTGHLNHVTGLLEDAALYTENASTIFYRLSPDYLTSKFGIFLVKDKNGKFNQVETTDLSLYEKTNRDRVAWWYEPIEYGKASWLEPYYNENIQSKIVSYVIPLYRNDDALGVVGIDIEFEKIVNMVNSVSFHTIGHAMLINSKGDLVYKKHTFSPDDEKELESLYKKIADLSNSSDSEELLKYDVMGETHYFSYRPLRNGMILVISVPRSALHESKYLLTIECFLLIIVGLLFSLFVTIRMTKKITGSLLKLTKSAELLGYGVYKLDFEINTDDEIGILAKTLANAADEIDRSNIQINKLAYFDSLTDIKNRHCFNRFVINLHGLAQQNVGAVFCDLNGLKYTNDNFGHEAGDKMICTFAEMLKLVFTNDEVFRLSGDEFIVFTIGKSKEDFYKDIAMLKKLNAEKEFPYASLGYVWAESTDNLEELLKLAEEEMYQEKKLVYEKFPEYKR